MVGRVGEFCIDPRSDVRRYGSLSAQPLDDVCTELFNGECELYKSFGMEGVKTLRYASGQRPGSYVNAVVPRFRSSEGAYGFFTRRILGDRAPHLTTLRPIRTKGRAALGTGVAYLWRGKQVVELTYVSDEETPQEILQRSPAVMVPLVQAIAEGLVGPKEPTFSVRFLESLEIDPLGVRISQGVLGVQGAGQAAVGYLSQAALPHRVVLAERGDATGAKDLLQVLRRELGHKKLKGQSVYVLRVTASDRLPETWYVRLVDAYFVAVGPLFVSSSPQPSTPAARKEREARWKEFAVGRLLDLEQAVRAQAAATRPDE